MAAAVGVHWRYGRRCGGLARQKSTVAALNMVHFDELDSQLAIAILAWKRAMLLPLMSVRFVD
jgi:hypothetical protein